jgi:hypothetical protein
MSAAALLLLCLAQQPAQGSLAQGLGRVQELAAAAQKDEALALCEALLAGRTRGERAALEYARGVVHAGANEREPARECFERSRADGAGELRLSSMYNLGSLALEQGEEWYHKLPEVSGKTAAPAPPPPAAGVQGQPPGPDPLAEARKSYLAARERFVERLRAQWNDADTRADVELVQRRLKRLDEIEKQRKEEKQKQDQQKQQDPKDPKSQQDKSDPKDKPDPDKQDPKDKDKDKQDPQPQDPQDKNKDKQDPQKPEPPKPDEQSQPGEQEKPPPQDAQQAQLSKEELTRLLDKLQQLEDQAAKLRAQIHKARRVAVKKDW